VCNCIDGAYDANYPGLYPVPEFTPVLSVDDPADQRYVTTAGGTTLPGKQEYIFSLGETNHHVDHPWSGERVELGISDTDLRQRQPQPRRLRDLPGAAAAVESVFTSIGLSTRRVYPG
jgi:hypothetical protein